MAIGVDEGLGSVARALRARGVWNDTLLVFLSDNGGVLQAGAPNTPLRGSKSTWLEGGIHVRAALGGGYVPAVLRGRASRTMLHEADFYPTLSYLAGHAEPRADPKAAARGVTMPVDGRNAAPSWRKLFETAEAAGFGGAVNELISPAISDWCGGEISEIGGGGGEGEGCVPGTRLIEHDRGGAGGHTFTFLKGARAWKVYSWNAPPCHPRHAFDGCPWDPSSWVAAPESHARPSLPPQCSIQCSGRRSSHGIVLRAPRTPPHCAWRQVYLPSATCPSTDVGSCKSKAPGWCDAANRDLPAAVACGPCDLGAISGAYPCRLYGPSDPKGCTPEEPCVFDLA